MKKLNGHITVSRSNSHDGDAIHITISDKLSGLQFFDGTMSLEDFGAAVTGLGHCHIEFEARGLQNVGKKCETKELVFPCEEGSIYDKSWAEANAQKFADEGWTADRHFRSQNSIRKHSDGKYYAHGFQRRYVEVS